MGLVDVDLGSVVEGGAKLVDSISSFVNADENVKLGIAKLVNSTTEMTLQSVMNSANNSTERLKSDNDSSEKSTKTIRPKLAIHSTVVITMLTIILLVFAFVKTPTLNQVKIVEYLLYFWGAVHISIIGFYFTPKGFEIMEKVKFNLSNAIAPKSTASGISNECVGCGSKEVLPNQFYCKECTNK